MRTSNLQVFRSLVDPRDVKIIESISLGRNQLHDRDRWHFTTSGKYTVKLGYQMELVYPDRKTFSAEDILLESVTPTENKAFSMANSDKFCMAFKNNLRQRGIHGDTCCAKCECTRRINEPYVFLNVLQQFKFRHTQSTHQMRTYSLDNRMFANMDHLFWRVFPSMEDHHFAWRKQNPFFGQRHKIR